MSANEDTQVENSAEPPWSTLSPARENFYLAIATLLLTMGLYFTSPSVLQSFDYIYYWKSIFYFFAEGVKEGRIPLWNPHVGLGRPFLADIQNAVFYPPTYLLVLGPALGTFLLIYLHCLIGAFGMRKLNSSLQLGKAQSYLVTFSFLACAPLTGRFMSGQLFYSCACCYFPWLCFFAMATDQEWKMRFVACYSLVMALQILCGHPQIVWISVLGQGAFIFFRTLGGQGRQTIRDLSSALSQFACAFVLCLGIVSAILLPFWELVQQGNRSEPSRRFSNFGSMAWWDFLSVGFYRPTLDWEQNQFVGAAVFFAGIAGLLKLRNKNARGLLAMGLVGVFLAAGDRTPLFDVFYKVVPGFKSFRLHARAGFLVAFALLPAAGIWLSGHTLLPGLPTRIFKKKAVHRIIFGTAVLFQLLGLVRMNLSIKSDYSFSGMLHISPDFPTEREVLSVLKSAALIERGRPSPLVMYPRALAPPNDGMIHGYSHCDAVSSLFLKRPWDYLHGVLGILPSEEYNTALSRGIYERGAFPYPDLPIVLGIDIRQGILHLNRNPPPRAFVVYAVRSGMSYPEILRQLKDGHNIHHSALVEESLKMPTDTMLEGEPAVIRQYESGSVVFDIEAKANGLLILTEAWYPGWKAKIDGRVYDTIPANGFMRAVPVPAGKHQIRMFFHQDFLAAGCLISLASLGLVIVAFVKNRPKPQFSWVG